MNFKPSSVWWRSAVFILAGLETLAVGAFGLIAWQQTDPLGSAIICGLFDITAALYAILVVPSLVLAAAGRWPRTALICNLLWLPVTWLAWRLA
ncbi:MAG: hypothetical protein SFV23_02510 [Planctomycetaceae bacterium]|nr:hypothetical protein [Planctomycetaceae bacterium]